MGGYLPSSSGDYYHTKRTQTSNKKDFIEIKGCRDGSGKQSAETSANNYVTAPKVWVTVLA